MGQNIIKPPRNTTASKMLLAKDLLKKGDKVLVKTGGKRRIRVSIVSKDAKGDFISKDRNGREIIVSRYMRLQQGDIV